MGNPFVDLQIQSSSESEFARVESSTQGS